MNNSHFDAVSAPSTVREVFSLQDVHGKMVNSPPLRYTSVKDVSDK